MQRIGIRDLRQYASRWLDLVKIGETVEVTDRGTLIALLVPPGVPYTRRQLLIDAGQLIPAEAPLQLPVPVKPKRGSPSTTDILRELREDRR